MWRRCDSIYLKQLKFIQNIALVSILLNTLPEFPIHFGAYKCFHKTNVTSTWHILNEEGIISVPQFLVAYSS